MALTRRSSQRFNNAIWPGFVDAMTGLLLVLMFVLTIFMVIQFVLRETITGQETQLDELAAEVATLAEALGIEQDRNNTLSSTLSDAQASAAAQAALIAQLTTDRDAAASQLAAAENQITGFEAEIAGLLSERETSFETITDLESQQAELLSEQERLNLALATARSEIDEGVEAARLAAAQREALDAMIAELQASGTEDAARISALEADRLSNVARISDLEAAELAQAAAAEALRERLTNADTELTAMTLSLEEKRREAEETLTILAATQAAREELISNLAAALLAQQTAETALSETSESEQALNAQLIAALAAQGMSEEELKAAGEAITTLETQLARQQSIAAERETDLQAQLVEALLAGQQAVESANTSQNDLETRLAEAVLARETLQAQIAELASSSDAANLLQDDLRAQLAAALTNADTAQNEKDRQAALLATANAALLEEEALSAESLRRVALLNAQVAELRNQVGSLQELLNVANASDSDANIQIEQLGEQLNTALARVAAEERRRAELEEAERIRLEEEAARLQVEAKDLERFKSDFFGQLRTILEGQEGVRIVGDRFVFSSEVLFQPAQAELSELGRQEIAKVAIILSNVADEIPSEIDWIIRVDGHTDDSPMSGFGQFRDNWELSQARALSVVRYMNESLGIPPNRLAANGFGQYQPINPADTDEARAQNRRIELKLTER